MRTEVRLHRNPLFRKSRLQIPHPAAAKVGHTPNRLTGPEANLPLRQICLLRPVSPFSAMAEPPQKRPVKFVASDQDGMPVKRRQVQQACEPCRKRKVRRWMHTQHTPLHRRCNPLIRLRPTRAAVHKSLCGSTTCPPTSCRQMLINARVTSETLFSRVRRRAAILRRCVSSEEHIRPPPG